ncbi:DUF6265 family protein [Flavobacterium sp.]|uniref:DUF6265 family protein n=1 Tax=Flavobacterium sp. TaxID=239 RepID=UPI0025F8F16E|nr:DUF6265 family protein [Flavobacterium sp.]
MNWILGKWEQKLPNGTVKETWTKENDSTFTNESYFINAKDTVHFESIKLMQTKKHLIYKSTVIGQNNDEPVDFKQTSVTENIFIFENQKHDYPQKIIYKKITENNFIETISGKQDNKKFQESYSLKKF